MEITGKMIEAVYAVLETKAVTRGTVRRGLEAALALYAEPPAVKTNEELLSDLRANGLNAAQAEAAEELVRRANKAPK